MYVKLRDKIMYYVCNFLKSQRDYCGLCSNIYIKKSSLVHLIRQNIKIILIYVNIRFLTMFNACFFSQSSIFVVMTGLSQMCCIFIAHLHNYLTTIISLRFEKFAYIIHVFTPSRFKFYLNC
jgi:hypothetical protein